MRNVIIVDATDPAVLAWFGHKALLNWTLDGLDEVRDLAGAFVAATAPLAPRVRPLAPPGVETVVVPAGNAEAALGAAVRAAGVRAGDVVAVVRPGHPLITAARVDACLRAARDADHGRAATGRAVRVYCPDRADHRLCDAVEEVFGVRAWRAAEAGRLGPWARPFRCVPVTAAEALDATRPDTATLAYAAQLVV